MQWAKLCPAEAIEGIRFIDGFWERFRQELQNLKRNETPKSDPSKSLGR